jgi:GDP-L-fucose synthase
MMANAANTMEAKVLVTGGSGMVGRALHSLYGDKNFIYLSSKDCNLCDYEATLATFKRIQPTHVIHLAANVGGLFKNMAQKVNMLNDNLLMNMNVLKACNETGVQHAVCCLSTCIFPDKVLQTHLRIWHSCTQMRPVAFEGNSRPWLPAALQVKSYPITEDMLHDGPPHFSNDAYAYAKRMMEVCALHMQKLLCASGVQMWRMHRTLPGRLAAYICR